MIQAILYIAACLALGLGKTEVAQVFALLCIAACVEFKGK